MTVFALTPVPNLVVMGLRDNTGTFDSPLTAAQQTLDRGGLHWIATYSWTAVRGDDRAELMGLLASMRGRANRIAVPVYDNPKRGAYGGTPLVAGASQTGSTLTIDGCDLSVTNWIRKGDYFSVDVNGQHELKMATADANTDVTGAISIQFEPRLRASPLDNAAIWVEDGVLPKPQGVFLLTNNELAWSSMPGQPTKRSALSLEMREDVFATQA